MKATRQAVNQELESIKGNFTKKMRNNKIKKEIDEIKKRKINLNEKTYIYIYIYIYNIQMVFNS